MHPLALCGGEADKAVERVRHPSLPADIVSERVQLRVARTHEARVLAHCVPQEVQQQPGGPLATMVQTESLAAKS